MSAAQDGNAAPEELSATKMRAAVDSFVSVWGASLTAHHLAEELVGHELDALVDLFEATGHPEAAQRWRDSED